MSDTNSSPASDHQAALLGFLAFLKNERRYSPLTTESYTRDLLRLFKLAGNTPLTELSTAQIRRYIATLHAAGLSGRSLARLLSAWRSFFSYLMRDHHHANNPCLGIRAPRSTRHLPHVLSPDDAVQMVNLPDTEDMLTVRDKAMFELLYSSGLRLAELINLNLNALNFPDGTVQIVGKGNKARIVPLGSKAITALQNWLPLRAQMIARDDEVAVFINRRGQRLGARNVQLRMKEWGIKQGLSSNVHPHLLRHSFASHVLQSSGDLRAVQEMLGHASISTTQVYTHLDFQHLSKIYDAAHPRARKKQHDK